MAKVVKFVSTESRAFPTLGLELSPGDVIELPEDTELAGLVLLEPAKVKPPRKETKAQAKAREAAEAAEAHDAQADADAGAAAQQNPDGGTSTESNDQVNGDAVAGTENPDGSTGSTDTAGGEPDGGLNPGEGA